MILTYRYRIKDRSAKKVLRQHALACNAEYLLARASTYQECAGLIREALR